MLRMNDGWLVLQVVGILMSPSWAFALDAPQLTGIVVDASGGRALARVRVRIDGTAQTTMTDDLGEFSFDDLTPGDHTLLAETVGYRRSLRRSVNTMSRPFVRPMGLWADGMASQPDSGYPERP